jgi:cytochrome P450
MLAGYETTSTTLTYCSYVLAKYPEEQQKLYDEISSIFGTNDENKVNFYLIHS